MKLKSWKEVRKEGAAPPNQRIRWWTNILLLLKWLWLWLLWLFPLQRSQPNSKVKKLVGGWGGGAAPSPPACGWFRRRRGQPKSKVQKLEGGWRGGRRASPPARRRYVKPIIATFWSKCTTSLADAILYEASDGSVYKGYVWAIRLDGCYQISKSLLFATSDQFDTDFSQQKPDMDEDSSRHEDLR